MANTPSRPRAQRWIAALAILWNLLGFAIFVNEVTMTPEQIAALPDAAREIRAAMPAWPMLVFAVAVGSGVVASLGLWLRQRWSVPTFVVSVLAMVLQFSSVYATTPAWRLNGVTGLIPAIVLVLIQVLFLRAAQRYTLPPATSGVRAPATGRP